MTAPSLFTRTTFVTILLLAVVFSDRCQPSTAQNTSPECTFCEGLTFLNKPTIYFSSGNDSVSCLGLKELLGVGGLSADFCTSERPYIEDACCQAPPNPSPTGSDGPTGTPTSTPTDAPVTGSPTGTPTSTPTGTPPHTPTGVPTIAPTRFPTVAPTRSPRQPSQRLPPTSPPTPVPTNQPTMAPPTENPTTLSPTGSPTILVVVEETTPGGEIFPPMKEDTVTADENSLQSSGTYSILRCCDLSVLLVGVVIGSSYLMIV